MSDGDQGCLGLGTPLCRGVPVASGMSQGWGSAPAALIPDSLASLETPQLPWVCLRTPSPSLWVHIARLPGGHPLFVQTLGQRPPISTGPAPVPLPIAWGRTGALPWSSWLLLGMGICSAGARQSQPSAVTALGFRSTSQLCLGGLKALSRHLSIRQHASVGQGPTSPSWY